MMCLAWNSKSSCQMAATAQCPSIGWWWLLAAGAGLVAMATGKTKGNGGK